MTTGKPVSTKEYDNPTAMNYYGYRFYNPELGRWINRDPIEEADGVNIYAFGRNSSINGVDVDGRTWLDRIPVIGDVYNKTKCIYEIRQWYNGCIENIPDCNECNVTDQAYCLIEYKSKVAKCLEDSKAMLEACISACY
jgi:RHS repeat-associated protein